MKERADCKSTKPKVSAQKNSDYDELEKFFKKIDQIWEKEYGKQCKDFNPSCYQCKFALIYNNFKQKVFDEVLK